MRALDHFNPGLTINIVNLPTLIESPKFDAIRQGIGWQHFLLQQFELIDDPCFMFLEYGGNIAQVETQWNRDLQANSI